MGIGQLNFMLSNINAVLGSANNALEGKKNGDDWGTSLMNFGLHTATGALRNGVAKQIYDETGSSLGYLANGVAGYGTNEADMKGMQGLFGASMLTSPWAFGGGMCGGGMFGGGWFGGGMPMMPMTPMMPMGGFMPSSYTEINITTRGGCHHHRGFYC